MSNIPTWHAVTSGVSTGNAGDINQFHGTHPASFCRQGTQAVTGAATATSTVNTLNDTWIDQPFTMSGTIIGRIELFVNIVASGMDCTVQLQSDNGSGKPNGTVLYQVTLPLDFSNVGTYLSLPAFITGLANGSVYHIVTVPTATSASNGLSLSYGATTGTAYNTSTNSGSTWTTGSGTLLFNIFQGNNGVLRNVAEDGTTVTNSSIVSSNSLPLRWTGLDYNISSSQSTTPTTYREYVGSIRGSRSFSYTSGVLTGVS